MLVSKAAHRYAIALLELADENKSVDQVLKDILFIKNTIEGSRDLLVFLKSPMVKPEKKVAALEAIFGDKVSDLVHKFITLIAKKGRENILGEITIAFIEKYNEYAGIITVEVRVAKALDENQLAELTQVLEKTTGKQVNIDLKVQPELKGGLAVKIDDTVIDGTIKHKLEQLEDLFLETAVL
ncbi:MAG: ATP synthase F1 subunit delta [Balneolaceae bacterium]